MGWKNENIQSVATGQEKPNIHLCEIYNLKNEESIHQITSHVCMHTHTCETTTVVIAERRIFNASEA